MSLATELASLVRGGVGHIGEIAILPESGGYAYLLCHHLDAALAEAENFGGLEVHEGPSAARDISTYAESGEYRFVKAQVNLRRGWVMALADASALREALDHFYPASVGLEIARRGGRLAVENLRDKLNRQTGMYRFARSISDEGAQRLVQSVCGPAHQCARRILWRIADDTPLEDSEASRYDGIPSGAPAHQAIPLLCREACNHFVAECRKTAKAEFEAKQAGA